MQGRHRALLRHLCNKSNLGQTDQAKQTKGTRGGKAPSLCWSERGSEPSGGHLLQEGPSTPEGCISLPLIPVAAARPQPGIPLPCVTATGPAPPSRGWMQPEGPSKMCPGDWGELHNKDQGGEGNVSPLHTQSFTYKGEAHFSLLKALTLLYGRDTPLHCNYGV